MVDQEARNKAEVIGSRYAIGMVLTGVGLVQVLLAGITFIPCRLCLNAPYFFLDRFTVLPLTFSSGGLGLFVMAHLLGKRAGRQTIIDNQPYWWTGPSTALATFFPVTCVTVMVSGFEMSWKAEVRVTEMFDNVLPGLLTVLWIGMYPAAFFGMIYGGLLKSKRRSWT